MQQKFEQYKIECEAKEIESMTQAKRKKKKNKRNKEKLEEKR